ncbi:hypothetical protein ACTMTI_37195 [Nonomuraea sp. H19]|uniref:hypothetical protein n=1 Tax=Nonomuraea sp. H19 TaxID=3452206 RepID=UPI003F8CE007
MLTRATLLTGSLVLVTSCATAQPAERAASPSPGGSVAVSPVTTAPTKGPEPVKPTGNAVDVRKVRYTKATPVSKGKKIKLTWWSGVAPCTVLHKVKVKETAKKVTITLYEGTAPKARNMSCIMIAVEKTYTVKLKKALGKRTIVDGAKS